MAGMPAAAAAAATASPGRGPSRHSRGGRAPAAAAAGSCRQLGSPGSRLASGGDESHAALEAALAGHRSAGAALAYPTGYMANIGAVQCLAEPGDTILSDLAEPRQHNRRMQAVRRADRGVRGTTTWARCGPRWRRPPGGARAAAFLS